MKVRDYGYLDDDNRIVYADDFAEIDGVIYTSPKAEHRARETPPKLPIDSTKPEKDGAYFVSTEYGDESVLSDGRKVIVRRYEERPIVAPPPQVVRYSKLKLIVASKAAGKWEAFKAFIAQAGYEDEWNAAQFLSSNYAQFEQANAASIAAGIATVEEKDAILAASVDEEVA